MLGTLRLASVLAILMIIFGAIIVGFAFPGFYVVATGSVAPGEPMHPEALAPTLAESGSQIALGVGLIIIGIATRVFARRKLRSQSGSPLPPNNSFERTRGR